MLTREQEQQVERTLEKTGNVKGLEYIQRLKNELRSKVDYIHEQDEIIDDYKHRAEVAERALLRLCDEIMRDIWIIMCPGVGTQVRNKRELYDYCIEQAEKELAEEE